MSWLKTRRLIETLEYAKQMDELGSLPSGEESAPARQLLVLIVAVQAYFSLTVDKIPRLQSHGGICESPW